MNRLLLLYNRSQVGLDLSFTRNALPATTSFARASLAEQVNVSGFLESVASDTARFDCDPLTHAARGILLEPQATNYLKYSTALSAWVSYNAPTVTSNAQTSPDGTIDASTIAIDLAGGKYISVTGLTSSATYSLSGYVKTISGGVNLTVGADSSLSGFRKGVLVLNLSTGSYTAGVDVKNASVVQLLNGWWWFCFDVTLSASQTSLTYILYASAAVAGTVFSAYGMQVSNVSGASYIPTSGSTVTRAADRLSITIPSGVSRARYTFDDSSTQDVSVSAGTYAVPTNLNRSRIKRIQGL